MSNQEYIFEASGSLYETDGTGITLLKAGSAEFKAGAEMAALPDGEVIFGVNSYDPGMPLQNISSGVQFWETNGTSAGTQMLGSLPDVSGSPGQASDTAGLSGFVTDGNQVLFEYNDGQGGLELYSTDGSRADTQSLNVTPDADSFGAGEGAAAANGFVFAAGGSLYETDGTGITLLKAGSAEFKAGPEMAALPDGEVIFGVNSYDPGMPFQSLMSGVQFWETNGTSAGTQMLGSLPDVSGSLGQASDTAGLSGFVTDGSRVLFEYNDGQGGLELYSTDGSLADTRSLNVTPDADSIGAGDGAAAANGFVFAAGGSLYETDGTGITLLKAGSAEFKAGPEMAALPDGEVIFGVNSYDPGMPFQSPISGVQLWETNGTSAGTQMLLGLPDGSASPGQASDTAGLSGFVTDGSRVLFEYNDGQGGLELYSTDGSLADTQSFNVTPDADSFGAGDGVALCYLRGTRLLTPTGEMPIEQIRAGDHLVTRFGGIRAVKWVGRQVLPGDSQDRPVRIGAGALGERMPARDLFVSPGHSLLIGGQLILARFLVNGITITQVPAGAGDIEYFNIDFGVHDCIIAEGCWAESFADAAGLRETFDNAAEYAALFPDEPPTDALILCAPRPEQGERLGAALMPVVARAGVVPGRLEGWLEMADAWRIEGWARDIAHPDLPVLLEVCLGGKVIGNALACAFREDLWQAGKGRCAFRFTPPMRLREEIQQTLVVRRAADGAVLPGTGRLRRAA